MNKAELIDHVAAKTGLTHAQATGGVTACFEVIVAALQAGEAVKVRGFGCFALHHRAPRAGRNPRTGASIPIPSRVRPIFRAGKALCARMASAPSA